LDLGIGEVKGKVQSGRRFTMAYEKELESKGHEEEGSAALKTCFD